MSKLGTFLFMFSLCLVLTSCEDWFMPDSNLISDEQFPGKVTNDKSCFKIVKFFTPNCPYCRYLKAVIDPLKHSREWCFRIYDFNCQWYPQFCMKNVRSSSFPYTAIYDQEGNIYQQIHGFYPESVITDIFQRIESVCKSATQPKETVKPDSVAPIEVKTSSLATEEIKETVPQKQNQEATQQVKKDQTAKQQVEPNQVSQVAADKTSETDQHKEAARKQQEVVANEPQKSPQIAEVTHQTVVEGKAKQSSVSQKMADKPQKMPAYLSYIFYGVCIAVAGVYVYSLHSKKAEPESSLPSSHKPSPNQEQNESSQEAKQTRMEEEGQQNGLLEIPDDQL